MTRTHRGALSRGWMWGLLLCGALGCSGTDEGGGGSDAGTDLGPDELPCDVKAVVAERCAYCHTTPLKGSAPMALLARSDFQRASSVNALQSVGQRSLERLGSAAAPMPPKSEPSLPDAQRAVLTAWLESGMPAGTCGSLPAGPAPTTCSSGSFWSEASGTGASMAPGHACRNCHLQQAPSVAYFFMGTVYPTLHEADGCDPRLASPSEVKVEILDSQGQTRLTLTPNAAGNFMSNSLQPSFPLPYRVRLVGADGRSREMSTLQTNGDCNTCHTEQGASNAPGRIALP
ncbi:hypothetical protein [Corallococcus sp. Z5C101001]|uniref:hypothetical protein n=1 Tax=Corallococcus sp. Z5C101001 TaxID=2596829 RepID=UPI00117ECC22|nr:hypothetical protein [Corallococcus sp. Z5C101001]TSC24480.1 hypothetical protein FOF48_25815 [Corallococcus sp. Z5C101001]